MRRRDLLLQALAGTALAAMPRPLRAGPLLDPFRGGSGAAPVNRTFAVQDFTTGTTTTGNQNYTTATLGGLTPKGAIVRGGRYPPATDPTGGW
jgi:hypothetical protein